MEILSSGVVKQYRKGALSPKSNLHLSTIVEFNSGKARFY